ncbi:conserved protein of unknown function (plasmid) [Rhodovastum atsumiense]|uniref:Uncharacterized protein n=1 Tax=Rhodovastum atsumiense TaxID=504468 RepID=A0A5M6IU67_9PROT|nr:hypothetical protein [Rhodovastum atsumiense]KAA5611863.1 hypothetical protein F1189_12585 [Rhodovastum atsumiense]CAH2606159.1 conserved protein of unknown function [Rhodovastum atsumiense]
MRGIIARVAAAVAAAFRTVTRGVTRTVWRGGKWIAEQAYEHVLMPVGHAAVDLGEGFVDGVTEAPRAAWKAARFAVESPVAAAAWCCRLPVRAAKGAAGAVVGAAGLVGAAVTGTAGAVGRTAGAVLDGMRGGAPVAPVPQPAAPARDSDTERRASRISHAHAVRSVAAALAEGMAPDPAAVSRIVPDVQEWLSGLSRPSLARVAACTAGRIAGHLDGTALLPDVPPVGSADAPSAPAAEQARAQARRIQEIRQLAQERRTGRGPVADANAAAEAEWRRGWEAAARIGETT